MIRRYAQFWTNSRQHVCHHPPTPAWYGPAKWDAYAELRDLRSMRDYDNVYHVVAAKGAVYYGSSTEDSVVCLDAATGDRIWEDLDVVREGRWSTIFMVQNGERTWMFTEEGNLIIAELTPAGYKEISRAKLIEPTVAL